jgi:hypothetical protein
MTTLEMCNEVRGLAKEVSGLAEKISILANELEYQLSQEFSAEEAAELVTKRPDGRLSETGIRQVCYAFEQPGYTNAAIAERFEISLSAVVKRRRQWQKEKARSA